MKEKGGQCRVLGCDGTPVNTGIHSGETTDISLFRKLIGTSNLRSRDTVGT